MSDAQPAFLIVDDDDRFRDRLAHGSIVAARHFLFGYAERPESLHYSAVRGESAGEDVQERRLTPAVLADDRYARGGRDREVNVVEDGGGSAHH